MQEEQPLLKISGTVPEAVFQARLRMRGLRLTLLYLAFVLLYITAMSLYDWFPDLRDGYITFGEWLGITWEYQNSSPFAVIILALFALYMILIQPYVTVKRMRGLAPSGIRVEYSFYDDTLVLTGTDRTGEETVRLPYAELRPVFREDRYVVRLSTIHRNRFSLYKCVMTPEELDGVRSLLRQHCP